MKIIGLTGSIATGKTTIASFFQKKGCPVYDADKAVHDLYQQPDIIAQMQEICPENIREDNIIDRKKLKELIKKTPSLLEEIETLIHPKVREVEQLFLEKMLDKRMRFVVLNIPLLFETKGEDRVDYCVTTWCPEPIQKARLKKRQTMSDEIIDYILAQQMPMAKKKRMSHFLINTNTTFEHSKDDIATIIKAIS